jgi:predicted AAA+ superfamily ATPase
MVLANRRKPLNPKQNFLDWQGGGNTPASCALAVFPYGVPWLARLPQFTEYVHTHGAGEFALYRFFCRAENGAERFLQPVLNGAPVRLADVAGYEDQRSVVVANTLRFIEGKPANNLLLHGDRGTGKSAAIKAVCNEYAQKGLRLVEVRKSGLFDLPRILDLLAVRSLRFIILFVRRV